MPRLEVCNNCKNIGRYGPLDDYTLTGYLTVYADDNNNTYVKRCCLIAYYIGAQKLNEHATNIDHRFRERMPEFSRKYIIHEESPIVVYKLKIRTQERISNLLTRQYADGDLVRLMRQVSTRPFKREGYTFTSQSRFNKLMNNSSRSNSSSPIRDNRCEDIGYIYLIRTSAYVASNENVYKIGRTDRDPWVRLREYENGIEPYLCVRCINSVDTESKILRLFNRRYGSPVIRKEYFRGHPDSMIHDIMANVKLVP